MSVIVETKATAKPFLKWAGGKGQLLPEIEKRLPIEIENGEIDTYVEPFIGGGAVFFFIAQRYEQIKNFYLFDINENLVHCYNTIKNDVGSVIKELKKLQKQFLTLEKTEQKEYFYQIRTEFNNDRDSAKLIFLNKTCFNGLYRVNKKGEYNVPFGDYRNPTICDELNLRSVSEVLQNAKIICGDFEKSDKYIDDNTFVYFDPPYRPLSPTASFTSYSKEDFNEGEQIRLSDFCRHIDDKGAKFLLSNSDPKNENPNDNFFEKHYKGFSIDTVKASRQINCKASGRGQINELIITNYVKRG
ncbi:MAG: DNA adenine methylase [Sedimentisphaerales bacterium]|nr:DNA adenine methylase [Sedimentisphaerales bacterium]